METRIYKLNSYELYFIKLKSQKKIRMSSTPNKRKNTSIADKNEIKSDEIKYKIKFN